MNNIFYNMCFNFEIKDLDIFLKAYIIRINKSSDPILIKIAKKSDKHYTIDYNKKTPIFFKTLFNTNNIKYSEDI